jgi:GT2 family glycosyltransferase
MNAGVSIIIVSYNVDSVIADCLDSIAAQTTVPYEVIIVDNASKDRSVELIRNKYPQHMLLESRTNLGFAGANNLGLKHASRQWVLFLNPDTIILDRAIDRMVAFIETRTEIGVLGPHTFNADGKTTQATVLYSPTLSRCFHTNIPLYRLVPFWSPALQGEFIKNRSGPVEVVKGSCMLGPKKLFVEIGGMNEKYFMYSEEVDFCNRIKQAGRQVFYFHDASIIHIGGVSSAPESEKMLRELLLSLYKYFERRYLGKRWALQLFRVFSIAGSLLRYMGWAVLAIFSAHKDAKIRQRNQRIILKWMLLEFPSS